MESFRLVCRNGLGECYMHQTEAENALNAFEKAAEGGLSPIVVVPEQLGRGIENTVVQRWKLGATAHGRCLNCGYELKGLIRAADGLAICPECGVGALMNAKPPELHVLNAVGLPGFKPGSVLDTWGFAFGLLGFLYFPLAALGVAMGAVAYEFSRGAKGQWAMRAGAGVLVIHGIILVMRFSGFRI